MSDTFESILDELQLRGYITRYGEDNKFYGHFLFVGSQNSYSRVWLDGNNVMVDYLNDEGINLHVAPAHTIDLTEPDHLEHIRHVLLDHPNYVPDLPSLLDTPDIRSEKLDDGSHCVIVKCRNYSSNVKVIGHEIAVTYCCDHHLPLPDSDAIKFSIVAVGLKQSLQECLLAHPMLHL